MLLKSMDGAHLVLCYCGDEQFRSSNGTHLKSKMSSLSTMPAQNQSLVSERHSRVSNALSVDVEDYFQVEAFTGQISPSDWRAFPSRVRQNTERVLQLFERHRVRGTFFVLGWVAERHPRLVEQIAAAGHEIACHSYAHRQVFRLTRAEFREDLRRAKAAIENAAGAPVYGYRAPTFSIMRRSLWALEILAEEGFLYDSSIFPVRHDLYGFPDAPRQMHRREFGNERSIIELPMSTVSFMGKNLPVGGGGWLRILPLVYTKWAIRRLHAMGAPLVVYFHPWELDPQQPRIAAPWKSKFRHYTGVKKMEKRLDSLLNSFSFLPIIDMIRETTIGDCLSASTAR